MDRLRLAIECEQPALVVFDSLVRMNSADENSADQMATVFQPIRELAMHYGCAMLFADHHRKPTENKGPTAHELRGSSEKHAAVDVLLALKAKNVERDGKQIGVVHVEHAKSRYSIPQKPFTVLVQDTPGGAVTIEYSDEPFIDSPVAEKAAEWIETRLSTETAAFRKDLVAQGLSLRHSDKAIDAGLKLLLQKGLARKSKRKREGGTSLENYYEWSGEEGLPVPNTGDRDGER